MQRFTNFITALFAMVITMMSPLSAWAVTASELAEGLEEDPSILALGYIFGDVGGLFPGAPDSVLGNMFSVFNAGILAVGGILVGYTILSGTLKTAHEGEVLGKSWSSIWIPLRTAIGMAMVLPGPGGYALVQVFIMFCAIVGIGLGNAVWNAATNFVSFGNTEVHLASDSRTVMNNILTSTACQVSRDRSIKLATGADEASFTIADTTAPTVSQVAAGTMISWGTCGNMILPKLSTGYPSIDAVYQLRIDETIATEVGIRQLAVTALVSSDSKEARDGIDQIIKELDKTVTTAAEAAYKQAADEDSFMQMVKSQGWMFAGASWLKASERLTKVSNAADGEVAYAGPDWPAINPLDAAEGHSLANALGVSSASNALADARKGVGQITADMPMEQRLEKVKQSVNLARSCCTMEDLSNPEMILAYFVGPASGLINAYLQTDPGSLVLSTIFGQFAEQQDPLMTLVSLGNGVSTTVIAVFAVLGGAAVVLGLANFMGTGGAGGAAAFSSYFGPVLGILALSITMFGMTLSTYLPMLPTIVWIMAVAGWFVLVLESMIAAPLWAIMHASPEGHEWSGKGSQGYMIILGLVLRPALMVFGLVGGMVLMRIFLIFASIAFSIAVNTLDAIPGIGGVIGPLATIVLFCIYVWLVVKLTHRAIQVITEVPSGIMRWAGGGTDSLGDDPHHEGRSFVAGVLGRGESAAQAGLGAVRGNKDKMGSAAAAEAKEAKEDARWSNLNNALVGKSNSGEASNSNPRTSSDDNDH